MPLLFLLPVLAQAQFDYTNINGAITILTYTGTDKTVNIPATIDGFPVTTLADWAFFDTTVTSVSIPTSVKKIGDGAFYDCTKLSAVTIPASVTNIGNSPFHGCSSLSTIGVDALNPCYSSVDGVLFNKTHTMLIESPGAKGGSYSIPDSVITIVYGAFFGCAGLTNVIIPGTVARIADDAFRDCNRIKSIYFGGNSPGLGWFVFYGATNATIYYLPGATGWNPTFGGRPTSVWNLPYPVILKSGLGFGVPTNGFGFRVSWATNLSVIVEYSTNLAINSWSPGSTNTLTNGYFDLSDHQWTNSRARLYRVRSP